jgi:hypothetical protein
VLLFPCQATIYLQDKDKEKERKRKKESKLNQKESMKHV